MLSKSLCILVGSIVILGGIFLYQCLTKEEKPMMTIGILQTATHPALDQAREGFIEELSRLASGKVRFVIQNAEGSLAQAQSIAENFHAHRKIDAIYAIATPAVQAAARVEKQKPIFIAAVSDPESLGVIFPGSNVCGTTDRIDTEAQADLILKLVPTVQTVAIIYNPGENNSQVMVEQMKKSLEKRELQYTILGVNSESEIAPTIAMAARKGDVILVPADNLLVGAMPLVAREALQRKRPLIASDIPSVTKGALIAQGADYAELGKATAAIAHRVLFEGSSPEEMGVVHPACSKILINKDVLEKLQIPVSKDLLSSAILIEEKKIYR